jgi:hypothetical protein
MWALTGAPIKSNFIRMERFDGIHAIQSHLNQRSLVESFVHGESMVKPDFSERRCKHCYLRKWLHGASGGQCSSPSLVAELHSSCREFQNSAKYAVEMVVAGQKYIAHALVNEEGSFRSASDRHQSSLARLHLSCERV